ncbi:hypothetical protein MMC07_003911 [Pseudocyphellaria aurata]|nr:hypothetical protein [Pseudocyphellaria aurata]
MNATPEDEIQDNGGFEPEATYFDDAYSQIQPAKYLLSSLDGDKYNGDIVGKLETPAPALDYTADIVGVFGNSAVRV